MRLKDGARRLLCADLQITERTGGHRTMLFLTICDHEFTLWLPAWAVWSHLYRRWQ